MNRHKAKARPRFRTFAFLIIVCACVAPVYSQTPGGFPLKINQLSAGLFELSWYGVEGVQYQLQSSPNLLLGWSDASDVLEGVGEPIMVQDGPITNSKKFY